MNSNLPILQQNTLFGFGESSGSAYLLLCEKFNGFSNRKNELKAFQKAEEYNRAAGALLDGVMTDYYQGYPPKLAKFFAKRYINNFMEIDNG